MRAIWKGAIAFGLVNVPVKVYSATEDHDISLHQVHNAGAPGPVARLRAAAAKAVAGTVAVAAATVVGDPATWRRRLRTLSGS